jgi:hypothetical protein
MEFDLGLTALAIMAAMALIFGVVTHFLGRGPNRWEWLISAAGFFVGGILVSELMFPGVTEEELQPVIDGLAFDEALLGGLIVGTLVFIATRFVTHGSPFHAPTSMA